MCVGRPDGRPGPAAAAAPADSNPMTWTNQSRFPQAVLKLSTKRVHFAMPGLALALQQVLRQGAGAPHTGGKRDASVGHASCLQNRPEKAFPHAQGRLWHKHDAMGSKQTVLRPSTMLECWQLCSLFAPKYPKCPHQICPVYTAKHGQICPNSHINMTSIKRQ